MITRAVKKDWLMMPASNATLANTIPGPPRALLVTPMLMTARPRKPAPRAARAAQAQCRTDDPTRNASVSQIEKFLVKSSLSPTIAKYTGMNRAWENEAMVSIGRR